MIGQAIGGRYEILRRIGTGGSAWVYLARDRILQRDVAVKVLREEDALDPVFVKRFKREAQSAARLSHPNIVSVYDWGEANGTYYLVMEAVPGRTLKEEIGRRGPLPEDEALRIAEEIAAALQSAHRRGVIHRDVKPQNVLLDESGTAKVVDFGIARATGFSQLTATNQVCGTANYLSPEQARGQPVDARSDVYSLGAVLWEMLTGRELFAGGSMIDIALRHVNEEPPSLRALRPGISPLTDAIVMTALAKDPAHRYPSADAMGQAIVQARAALKAVQTAPVSTAGASGPQSRSTERRSARPESRQRASRAVPAASGSTRWPAARQSPSKGWLAAALAAGLLLVSGIGFLVAEHAMAPLAMLPRPTLEPRHLAAGARAHHPSPAAQHGKVATAHHTTHSHAAVSHTATAIPTPTATSMAPSAPATVPPTIQPASPPAITMAEIGSGPVQAIQSFYTLVNGHQFGQAAQLWTPAMQQVYPPSSAINERFSGTRQISLIGERVLAQTANSAVVGVDVLEVQGSGQTVEWIGTWNVVRRGGRWLLNWPNLHQA